MSAGKIKGITVEIGGDTRPLNDALKKSEKQIKTTQSELREVNRQLKFDPTNTELLRQKQTLLASAVSETRQKLDALKQAEKQAQEQFKRGDISAEQYRSLQREVIKTEGQLKSLEKQASRSNEALAKVETVSAKVGEESTKLGKKLTPLTGVIAAAGVASGKMASEFDDAFAKVTTIADESEVPVDDLRKAIINLSDETGIAAVDIADNVYNAISAGQKTGDAVNFVGQAARLAKAGFTESSAALDIMTTALNAYQLESSEATRVSDLLIQTQNLGKTTVAELSTSMGKVIPTAKANNVQIDQLCTGYAILTANGIATAESTTYMNAMLNELGKGGTKVNDILKQKTGKSFAELSASGKTLGDVLSILNGYAKENGKSFGDLWSSSEASKAGLVLLGNGADTFNAKLKEMNASTGATDKAFDKLNTTSNQAKIGVNEIKNTVIDFGSVLLASLQPALQGILEKIKNLTNWFKGLSEGQKEAILKIAALVAAIGPALLIFGKVATSVSSIVGVISKIGPAVKVAKTSFSAFNTVLAANPVMLVVGAITALVAGFAYLWKNCEGLRNFWIGLWDKIKTVTSNAVEILKTFFAVTIPNAFNAVIDWIKANWQGLLLLIVNPFAGAFKLLYDNCEGFRNFINNFLQKIKDFFVNTWNSIVTFFTESIPNAFAQLVAWFSELPEKIGYEIGRILANIVNFGVNAWNWVTTELPKIIQGIVDWFASLPGRIWTWLVNAVNNVIAWGTAVKNHATALIKAAIDAVVNWFATLPSRIWTWLVNAKNRVTEWGTSVKERASSLIKQTIDVVVNWFKSLPDRVKEWLTKTKDRVVSWGKETAQKGKEGAQDLFNNIVNTVKELPGKMLDIGKNIVTGIWDGIKNKVTWIKNKIKDFAGGIVKGFKDNLEIHSPSRVFADQIGKFIPEGIWQGISGAMGKLQSNMKQSVGRLVEATQGSVNATMMTTAGGGAVGKSMSFTQNNTFNGYQSRDGARVVEDLNRKLGIAYGGAF